LSRGFVDIKIFKVEVNFSDWRTRYLSKENIDMWCTSLFRI